MDVSQIIFSYEGRIKRQDWWIWSILVGILGTIYSFILGFVSVFIFYSPDEMESEDFLLYEINPLWATTMVIFLLPYWYVQLAISMKRLQDTGKSWEWGSLAILSYIFSGVSTYLPLYSSGEGLLFTLSTIAIIPIWIICGFIEGTHGSNEFGPDPIQRQFMPPQASFDNAPGVYNSAPSGTGSVNTSELKELGELRDSGIISEAEFQKEKDKILGGR